MASMATEQESDKPPLPKTAAFWIASGFGFGLAPVASGTFGALWGLPLAWGIGQVEIWWQVPLIILVCAVGIPLSTRAARDMGGVKDPGAIVFDEIASMPITAATPNSRPSMVSIERSLCRSRLLTPRRVVRIRPRSI